MMGLSSAQLALCLMVLGNSFMGIDCQKMDEFKACAVPSFDWATYSTSTTGRMYGIKGAYSNGFVYAAGYVKSTIDASTPEGMATRGKFSVSGPYSVSDPTGANGSTVSKTLQSYTTAQGAKENAGGTWGQYEVGVAKIDANTGAPVDFFIYEGHGLDETTGLAAAGDVLALSGHFTGNLTALLSDGSSQTIWNSNVAEGGVADNADQYHPNTRDVSGDSGVDDGFVIKMSASTGKADWIVRYPESNKDAQMVVVDIDDADGSVYGAGYRCAQAAGAETKTCDGIVAKLSATDGSIIWEKVLPQLGAAFRMVQDNFDEYLYVVGSTTFSGMAKDAKENPLCDHATCSVIISLSAADGAVQWERTLEGSPRWGVFGQNGGIGMSAVKSEPYIFVAIDDTGEKEAASPIAGSSYSGCRAADGTFTPEYNLLPFSDLITAASCPAGSTFVPRNDVNSFPASKAANGVTCGDASMGTACVIKFNKYTGYPIWATDVPDVAGIVPSYDGRSVHIGGWYSSRGGIPTFGSVKMPEYLREQGLDGKSGGVYNAKLNAETGKGEFVMSSGGGNKDRLNDMVGDPYGNIYNIGYHQNLVMRWGNNLETTMVEDNGNADPNPDNPTQAVETQLCVSKMAARREIIYSCLEQCTDDNTDNAIIQKDSCFIDGKCYPKGGSTKAFGKSCFLCDPDVSQRTWTEGPTIGDTECFIKGTCVKEGQNYYYQRRAWNSPRVESQCQMCYPKENARAWSVKAGYDLNVTLAEKPPKDCSISVVDAAAADNTPSTSPIVTSKNVISVTPSPTATPTQSPTESSGLGTGAIVAIAFGGVLGVGLIMLLGCKLFTASKDEPMNQMDDKASLASIQ